MSDAETVSVSSSGDAVVIDHSYMYANNHVMKNTFVISKSSASWLAEHVVKTFNDQDGPYDFKSADDSLHVSIGGPDQEPCVNVTNRRAETATRPGVSGLNGLSEPGAHDLAAMLRAI